MGIKNLKQFLRKRNLVSSINVGVFRSHKIAIDISSFIYKYKITCGENYINNFISLILLFKSHNIHVIFVFEGKALKDKDKEKLERKDARDKTVNDIVTLKNEVEKYLNENVIGDLLCNVNTKLYDKSKSKKIKKLFDDVETVVEINIEEIQKYIEKKEKQMINISSEDITNLKELFSTFGVPYICANTEAETLCCKLYHEGKVKAVISEDTDILAYSCGIFISNLKSNGECECVLLDHVYKELDINAEQFLDFCIMCGNDYNNNIPLIGCEKAYLLIKEHGNIESVEKNKGIDTECLKYVRCRQIFQTFGEIEKENVVVDFWDSNKEHEDIITFLNNKGYFYNESVIRKIF